MLATFIAEPAHIEHSFVTERWEDILLLLPSEVKLSPFNLKTPKRPLWAMTQKTKRKIKNKEHRLDCSLALKTAESKDSSWRNVCRNRASKSEG